MSFALRYRNSRLDRLLDQRASKKLAIVNSQVDLALAELRRRGARIEIFGSMARGEFRAHSDVDFLVTDRGYLSEVDVFNVIAENLKEASFDIVYADRVTANTIELMRFDAQAR